MARGAVRGARGAVLGAVWGETGPLGGGEAPDACQPPPAPSSPVTLQRGERGWAARASPRTSGGFGASTPPRPELRFEFCSMLLEVG